jgi:hypothetical protein
MANARKREAAVPKLVQEFGVNPSYLYKLIQMGTLEARRDAFGRWQVTQASFELWNQRRLKRTEACSNRSHRQLENKTEAAPVFA